MRWNQKLNLSAGAINAKGFINRSILLVYDEDTQAGQM